MPRVYVNELENWTEIDMMKLSKIKKENKLFASFRNFSQFEDSAINLYQIKFKEVPFVFIKQSKEFDKDKIIFYIKNTLNAQLVVKYIDNARKFFNRNSLHEDNTSNHFLYYYKEMFISVIFYSYDEGVKIAFIYKSKFENDAMLIINNLDSCCIDEKISSKLSLLTQRGREYEISEFKINTPKIDNIKLSYGDSFEVKHNLIVERLNVRDSKGVILLHGLPGTGKTTYIQYLTSLINDKKIIFTSINLIKQIDDPGLIRIFIENNNSILIVEDAESLIQGDKYSRSSELATLLNLGDGLLNSLLSTQLIITFNKKIKDVDPALVRPGRLIVEHEFGKLDIEHSNRLLQHLGKKQTVNEPKTLAELYNIENIEFEKKINEEKIGF